MEPLALPPNLVEAAEKDGLQWWLATLPSTVTELAERWSLEVGAPFAPGDWSSIPSPTSAIPPTMSSSTS